MILETLLYHKDLDFVDKWLGHVNQQKKLGKAQEILIENPVNRTTGVQYNQHQ